jgi:hypothetical protein
MPQVKGRALRPKLSPEHIERLLTALATGVSMEVAAKSTDVCLRTARYWKYEGREFNTKRNTLDPATGEPYGLTERETLLADFYVRIAHAQAQAERSMLEIIRKEAPRTWQAAAWFLERVYPQRYARRDRFEHSGINGKPIQTQAVVLDEIDAAMRAARENEGVPAAVAGAAVKGTEEGEPKLH